MTHFEPIDRRMLDEIWGLIEHRQARFVEDLEISVKVVLANYGDEKRIAHCISGDWSGPKSELAQAAGGLPLCPRCRKPCTEESEGWTLALIAGYDPWAISDTPLDQGVRE